MSEQERTDDEGPEKVADYSGEPDQDMQANAPDPRPRSVNKKLLMGLGAGVVLLSLGVIYASTLKQKAIESSMQGEDATANVSDVATLPPSGAGLPSDYEEMRVYNRQREIDDAASRTPPDGVPPAHVELPESLKASGPAPSEVVPQHGPSYDQNDPRLMAARQEAMQRLTAQTAARNGSSSVRPTSSAELSGSKASLQGLPTQQQPTLTIPDFPDNFPPDATLQANNQGAKQDYIEEKRQTAVYLNQPLIKPASPYQVMAGNIIPSSLITGLNSDLPGLLTAQVRHNVYDSVTGRHLLIPQGTRIVGEYSSAVTYGQNRALVVWNRLIYPNGKSIVLEGMPGVDLSGYAGFKDKVDYHFMRMLGSALLGSIVATAADAAEDDGDSLSDNVLGGTAETADQTIQRLIQKQLNVQPTIKIRPGYRFNIVVLADMILEPYDPRPATVAKVSRR